MATEPNVRVQAAILASGGAIAPPLLGLLEAFHVEGASWGAGFLATTRSVFVPCGPSVAFLVLLGLPTLLIELDRRAARALQALVAAALAGLLLAGLWSDAATIAHPAVWAGAAALVIIPTIEITLRPLHPIVSWLVGIGSIVGVFAVWIVNYRVAPGSFPEAHWAFSNLTLVLLGTGVANLLLALSRHFSIGKFVAVAAGLGVVTSVVASIGASKEAMRQVAADTEIGRARLLVVGPTEPVREQVVPAIGLGAAVEEARPFDLPDGFTLDDWDLLFISASGVRSDETSLGSERATTPNLKRWKERGAMSFELAYSPSSNALQSLGATLTMLPPSCAEFDLYPHGAGLLREDARTAAEILTEGGRDTFWLGHNHAGMFNHRALGFEQGFKRVERVEASPQTPRPVDDVTGDALVELLRKQPAGRRVFGYVEFGAGLRPFPRYYDEMPAKTPRDRYRQGLRKMDEQLGKLLDVLDETKRLHHTIVVITSDHGNEFGGTTGQNHTVLDESVRVPLLVWLPGAKSVRPTLPTSTGWVIPWLLLHGSSAISAEVQGILQGGWGPMLAATEGAVIVEQLRGERSQTALVTPSTHLILDLAADRAFALEPTEQASTPSKRFILNEGEQSLLSAYAAARRGCERFAERRPKSRDPED